MPSYKNSVVVVHHSNSRPTSVCSFSTSSSSSSTSAMDRSSNPSAQSLDYDGRYRAGGSDGYYTNVKQSKSRDGKKVVVINHKTANPSKDEPRASEYNSSGHRSNR